MTGAQQFGAPWGRALKVITALSAALLLAIPCLALLIESSNTFALALVAIIPPLILLPSVFFMIRGYAIENRTLLIRRLGWNTRVSLADLRDAKYQRDAMKGSIRLFGNGGLFSFTGLYRNRELGLYRAFVTDLNRSVVLTFATRKPIVISPDNPDLFVTAILTRQTR